MKLSPEQSLRIDNNVRRILDMWVIIEKSKEGLSKENKEILNKENILKDFFGFRDSGEEEAYYDAAKILINIIGDEFYYNYFKNKLRAPAPVLDIYYRMLRVFEKEIKNSENGLLNINQLLRVLRPQEVR